MHRISRSPLRHGLAALLIACSAIAQAAAPLADPLEYLGARGIQADEATLRAAWVERGHNAQGAERSVYGFLVDTSFHYFDAESGTPLDAAAVLALGILPKQVDSSVNAVDSETVTYAAPKFTPATPPAYFTHALPEIILPPVDREALIAEDEAREAFAKGRLRLGVATALPEAITRETFHAEGAKGSTSSGRSMRGMILRTPGALGLRILVRFAGSTAPAGFQVAGLGDNAETFAPAPDEGTWWSPTIWDEALLLSCDDALTTDFSIEKMLQIYRMPGDDPAKAAGACEVDVTCHERWAETALGVGGIGTVDNDEFIFCTASLLVDADASSAVPYLLTANHCVNGSAEAQPLEVYWLYQTATCNGAPPDLADVPRTLGGAVFLAGNGNFFGTDVSLLRLKRNPPSGLTWLGWETAAPGIGADIVGIHHPDGDFKRISFGILIDSGSALRPASRYHEVGWNSGVTEPGSSGSPIFLESTQRIVGQLYGGGSSCRNATAPDYYGRFDVSYLMIQQYLGYLRNPYDVNGDRRVNAADLQRVVNAALTRPTSSAEDLSGDGRVEAIDIQRMVVAVLSFSS